MLVLATQMSCTSLISPQLHFLKLRNRDTQGMLNILQPRILSVLWCAHDLFEEVSAKRVVRFPNRPIWLSNKLRHNVDVTNR